MLGVYVEEALVAADGVVALTDSTVYRSEYVWYAEITETTSHSRDCPYSVGSSGVLNTLARAALVISISTGNVKIPCLLE